MEFAEILDSFTTKPCDEAIVWLLTQVSLADAWNIMQSNANGYMNIILISLQLEKTRR